MTSKSLVKAAQQLRDQVGKLHFAPPVAYAYNPLEYAWKAHKAYLTAFGGGSKRVIFLGMNPGPFGMAQTGIPFGEIAAVRDWLGLSEKIGKPAQEHPRRLVTGFACTRSEVSGRRLWGLFAARFGSADKFFRDHLVMNYCPLAFLENGGRNLTPNKLLANEKLPLFSACDRHLREVVRILEPEWLVGVGDFAAKRAKEIFNNSLKIGRILHPSPASPAANRNWPEKATLQLQAQGIWD